MVTSYPEKTPLPECWMEHLGEEFEKNYMKKVKSFLASELVQGVTVYPHGKEIFSAFNLAPLNTLKVIIVGQDPYHGPGQAHGLSFSVRPGVRTPPSLQNIYKEINSDLNIPIPQHGYLEYWATQGVLMLNNVLTVRKHKPASHSGKGWELFTDKVVDVLNREKDGLVFLLWGKHARVKCSSIDRNKHLVLEAAHPSPFAAYRGFFGCKHFSKANSYLKSKNLEEIDWSLPDLSIS